jgi:hypothetical protein
MIDRAWSALGAGTLVCAGLVLVLSGSPAALADRIKHPTAIFAGLDKITGRIISFEVATDETVQFGSLQITPRICYTRPPTEPPQTTTFVEIDEISANGNASNDYKRLFTGWMFAASPGLHALEHPVYDVWLTDCKGGKDIIVTPPELADLPPDLPADAQKGKNASGSRPKRVDQGFQTVDPMAPPVDGTLEGQVTRPASAPAEPRRSPTQRFFPTVSSGGGRDPAGNNK